MGGWWSTPCPGERPGTHSTQGWVGPGMGAGVWKISLQSGFDPQTVQPVASRRTDWAILALPKY
jgi:hypothetical protein